MLPQPAAKHLSPGFGMIESEIGKVIESGRQAMDVALVKLNGESTLAKAMSWYSQVALYFKIRNYKIIRRY